MSLELNQTHDPTLTSWVEGTDDPNTDFPIQNLPFGVYRKTNETEWRCGVAIGNSVFDLAGIDASGTDNLNWLAAAGPSTWHSLRRQLSAALSDKGKEGRMSKFLTQLSEIELTLPVQSRDYTDFFTSYDHAHNTVTLFRPDKPVSANFKWMPIAYHGRASSIMPSGSRIQRPLGQRLSPDRSIPVYEPSAFLDYEVELGVIAGPGNTAGEPISIENSEDHIFGLVLLNDWSARDIQGWESDPLGPFLSKNFATTISPWVVTLEALAPFRHPAVSRPSDDPQCLPHLTSEHNELRGHFDIEVEAWLTTSMSDTPFRLSKTSYKHSYWTPAQMVTHHSSNGCPLNPGDLLGTGTISGPTPEETGCLLERTYAKRKPIQLPGGEQRAALEDNDTVFLKAYCKNPDARRIGFGEASGHIVAARNIIAQ
ncbi:MAG: fumarylacetoacetase [Sneathiellales bacterium]|nr:fumarylacetoacetase [Sneathiellales bacterium]